MTVNHSYILIIIIFFGCTMESKEKEIKPKLNQKSIKLFLDIPFDTLANEVVEHTAYALGYSEEHEQASWVQYKLYKSNLELQQVKRKDKFKEDTKISTGSASLNDYKKSGFDRGHLAPCADFTYSNSTMLESFFMSNMSPQIPSFNRGKWKVLESKVREYAFKYDSLLIITGPVLYSIKEKEIIGNNNVTIPEYYYKIIIVKQNNTLKNLTALNFKVKIKFKVAIFP